jgi:predicted RNA-binding Zn-ribbon protein involved in translation (DUF1610 family)
MKTVILKTFDNYFYANLLLARMQNAGINCFLKDEHTVAVDPLISNAIGGIKVMVYEDDVPAATELLKTIHGEQINDAVCPRCGNKTIIQMEAKKPRNLFSAFMRHYVLFSPGHYYLCKNCGFRSNTLPDMQADNDIGTEWKS